MDDNPQSRRVSTWNLIRIICLHRLRDTIPVAAIRSRRAGHGDGGKVGVAEEAAQSVAFVASGRGGGGAEQTVDAGAGDARRAEAEARSDGGDEAERGAVGEQQRRQRPLQRRACRHGKELADHGRPPLTTCSALGKRTRRTRACEVWRRRKKFLVVDGRWWGRFRSPVNG